MPKIAFATMLLTGAFAAGVALADNLTMTLQKDVAVVAQPGVGAKADALDAGMQVTVIDINGEWAHIQTGSGVDGWVPTGALRQ